MVYLHGCAGLFGGSDLTLTFLAQHGFAAVAPDSFARTGRQRSCDAAGERGGLDRSVLALRQAEARHALQHAARLPWADTGRLFLMGFSEGGTAVATLDSPRKLAGRIIGAWTCHSPWLEYRGLRSPPDEPVLALLAADDPWYRAWWLRGDCGDFASAPGSRSVVFREPPLAGTHFLLQHGAARRELLDFLRTASSRAP